MTFNPYTGCDHECVYCYASSYVPNFSKCRQKKRLLQRLQQEARKLKGETISIANSSDPYPGLEAKNELTRGSLKILVNSDCRIQIVTKSDLVVRDKDLLSKVPSTVSLTITTDDVKLARLLEPQAPPPELRLRAAEDLTNKGIPVCVRIDPIIPFINDQPKKLVTTLASIGVKHVTSSTYKLKPDNWRRLSNALPNKAEKLKPLYFKQGDKMGGNRLLPRDFRFKLMKKIRDLVASNGMQFGVCREGLAELNTASCDGSWLLDAYPR